MYYAAVCSTADDYFPVSGSVIFPDGQGPGAIQSFTFTIVDDLDAESVESFSVKGAVSTVIFPVRFSNNQNSDTVSVDIEDNDGELSRSADVHKDRIIAYPQQHLVSYIP